jgi:aspartokinase-like uncharacterized kinase
MRVVKLGGSLNRDPLLRDWLQLLAGSGAGRVVIVPGGGGFADQVREHQAQWRFDELTAHNMAVLAMMQSAMLMLSLAPGLERATTPDGIARVLQHGRVAVWSPGDWIREQADDMTHWGATSDSLAAWLATRLGATSLVLVKSCEIQPGLGLSAQAQRGVLDADFCRVAADARYSIELLGKAELPRMRLLLAQPATGDAAAC